jgi:hypothetical protein
MLRVILLDRSWTGESTRSHSASVLQYPIFRHGMHSHDYDIRGILASMTSTERVAIFEIIRRALCVGLCTWAHKPIFMLLPCLVCRRPLFLSNVPSVTLLLSKMSGPLGSCSPYLAGCGAVAAVTTCPVTSLSCDLCPFIPIFSAVLY